MRPEIPKDVDPELETPNDGWFRDEAAVTKFLIVALLLIGAVTLAAL